MLAFALAVLVMGFPSFDFRRLDAFLTFFFFLGSGDATSSTAVGDASWDSWACIWLLVSASAASLARDCSALRWSSLARSYWASTD